MNIRKKDPQHKPFSCKVQQEERVKWKTPPKSHCWLKRDEEENGTMCVPETETHTLSQLSFDWQRWRLWSSKKRVQSYRHNLLCLFWCLWGKIIINEPFLVENEFKKKWKTKQNMIFCHEKVKTVKENMSGFDTLTLTDTMTLRWMMIYSLDFLVFPFILILTYWCVIL